MFQEGVVLVLMLSNNQKWPYLSEELEFAHICSKTISRKPNKKNTILALASESCQMLTDKGCSVKSTEKVVVEQSSGRRVNQEAD